jgi:prefoldin subunit 5
MSEFQVSTEYKLQTLTQRLEQLNVEGWSNEEARTVANALGNTEEVERLNANIEIIKSAIVAVQAQIDVLA